MLVVNDAIEDQMWNEVFSAGFCSSICVPREEMFVVDDMIGDRIWNEVFTSGVCSSPRVTRQELFWSMTRSKIRC